LPGQAAVQGGIVPGTEPSRRGAARAHRPAWRCALSSRRVRATVVLCSLAGLLLTALAGPAHAAASPAPAPSPAAPVPTATSTPLPEGPWPPDEILARPPAGVAPRSLAAAAPRTSFPGAPDRAQE